MINKELQKNFTMLNNDILQSQKLSFGARGLYIYMKSKEAENNSVFNVKELAENGGISVMKCKMLLLELLKAGLVKNNWEKVKWI